MDSLKIYSGESNNASLNCCHHIDLRMMILCQAGCCRKESQNHDHGKSHKQYFDHRRSPLVGLILILLLDRPHCATNGTTKTVRAMTTITVESAIFDSCIDMMLLAVSECLFIATKKAIAAMLEESKCQFQLVVIILVEVLSNNATKIIVMIMIIVLAVLSC